MQHLPCLGPAFTTGSPGCKIMPTSPLPGAAAPASSACTDCASSEGWPAPSVAPPHASDSATYFLRCSANRSDRNTGRCSAAACGCCCIELLGGLTGTPGCDCWACGNSCRPELVRRWCRALPGVATPEPEYSARREVPGPQLGASGGSWCRALSGVAAMSESELSGGRHGCRP